MGDIKKIQAFYFVVSAAIGITLYFHQTFASTARVERLEDQIIEVHSLLCEMAIEQKLSRATNVCARHK